MSLQNQQTVPFWIPAADGESLDDMLASDLSGTPAATGLLGLEDGHLHIQWSKRAPGASLSFWKTLSGGETSSSSEPRRIVSEISIPLADLASAQVKGRWGRTIRLTTNALSHFADIPGVRGHELTLKVARRHREDAERLVHDLQMRLSDLGLARLDGEIARLEGRGDQ